MPKKKTSIKILSVGKDGALVLAPSQPPDDFRTVEEVRNWMKVHQTEPGTYVLARFLRQVVARTETFRSVTLED